MKCSRGEKIFQVCNYVILFALALVCVYPVWYVLVASFSDSDMLMRHTGLLMKPLGFTLVAYERVFENPMIWKGYCNTFFVLGVGLALDMLLTSLGAYFLSRKNVLFQKPIYLQT